MEKRVVFLKGKKVNLRPLQKEDISEILQLINDPDVTQFMSAVFPSTKEDEDEWYEKIRKSKEDVVLVVETHERSFIGLMGIHRINWQWRVGTTGAGFKKEFWNKGFGQDAKMQLLNYAFNGLNLRKICSEALAKNKRSIAYNQRCGYKIEGVRRKQSFKNGRYHDHILLAVFKSDWLPLWRKYNSE